jgi:hypothetical protein
MPNPNSTPQTAHKTAVQQILTGNATFATTLLVLVVDTYGTECFEWSPETLVLELTDDFDVSIPAPNLHRLLTAIEIVTSDSFYQSLPDFVQHCNILCGDIYDPNQWDPADANEVAWGVTEALMLSPPEGEEPFTEEITAYIGSVLDDEGIINPPDVLKIATRDRDVTGFVAGEFSDDPIMFNAVHDFESSKTEDINRMIRSGLQRLAAQLESLPVRSGETKNAVQQMLQNLGQ